MPFNGTTKPAVRLHNYLTDNHWDGTKLVGPDPIGRIHWRVTRFIRSYLPFLPGDDRYTYLQGQAYWIRGNLKLFNLTNDRRYLGIAARSADFMVGSQPSDGGWPHPPIRGRRGFRSTVEGVWASLGLTAVYRESGNDAYLQAALRWYDFQLKRIGFQEVGGGLASNYYAQSTRVVPNVTTMLIWLSAELCQITGNDRYLEHTDLMLNFVEYSQMSSGELPYELDGRIHYQCYQYNSFEFIDLARYYQITGDGRALPILGEMARYLAGGLTERGSCRSGCFRERPEANYWTAALALALYLAHELQLGDYRQLSDQAYRYLLTRQQPDGAFDFSEGDYVILRDTRSYPRYLAIILDCLLHLGSRLREATLRDSIVELQV